MTRRRFDALALSWAALGASLTLGCQRSPESRAASHAETVAWSAPGISALDSQSGARYVVRDGAVSAFFMDRGFSLALGTCGGSPTVQWTLTGTRPVVPRPEGRLPGRVHRLQGEPSEGRAGKPTYASLSYANVYPGVTLTVETRRHAVAYRFDLDPGADAKAIRMRYDGADGVSVEEDGKALRIRVGSASLQERGLRCYQDEGQRRDIPCRYAPTSDNGSEITIALGPHDPSRSVVIDPEIGWSAFLGGSGIDYGRAIAIDAAGNIYVTGYTSSLDFPTNGGFDTSVGGFYDAYITKVAPGGMSVVWSSYLGGDDDDYGYGVAVDTAGNAYVAGYTYSSDFPAAAGFDDVFDGWSDAFVAKVNASGASLDWASYLGGSSGEEARAIAVDSGGNAYVTGNTSSDDFPVPGGFDTTRGGSSDVYVTKVDASGSSLAWSTYLGGASSEYGWGIAVDGAGAPHVTGYTNSSDFPLVAAFDDTMVSSEVFVTKVDAAGSSLAWSTYLGGSSSEQGYGIALDSTGDVYVAGQTYSSDFPTAGGFDTTQDGAEAFVAKIATSGPTLAWSSYLGGTGSDYGYDIAVDSSGSPCVVGYTYSEDFPVENGFDMGHGGSSDGFATMVDPAGGALLWSTFIGGGSTDHTYGVAVDSEDNVVVTGYTYSTDFPVMRSFDTTIASTPEAYVVKVVICGNGTCDVGEDPCNCPADCGADTCGNGCCGPMEDSCNCVEDCPDLCGNGCCGPEEDSCNCPADCGADTCGNGCCGSEETACNCIDDCPDLCGDGCCTGGENPCGCSADCGEDTCGSGCCGPGETACNCETDCIALCGDDCCTGEETCATCPLDCGACTEPGPDGGGGGEESDGCSCALGRVPRGAALPALWLAFAVWVRRRRS